VAQGDKLVLDNAIFTALVATGALNAANLRSGAGITTAADANDFILYNSSAGIVYYDADGSGGGSSPVQVVQVVGLPALTAGLIDVS
jgi:Ca2+-binding RTX toxin-like protein